MLRCVSVEMLKSIIRPTQFSIHLKLTCETVLDLCAGLWHVVTHFSPAAREDLKIVELSSALTQHYHSSNCTPTSPHTSNIKHTAVTDSWRLGEGNA